MKSKTFDCLLSLLIYCCQMVTLVTPSPVDGCPFAGDSPVIPSIPWSLSSNIMTLLIHCHVFDCPPKDSCCDRMTESRQTFSFIHLLYPNWPPPNPLNLFCLDSRLPPGQFYSVVCTVFSSQQALEQTNPTVQD